MIERVYHPAVEEANALAAAADPECTRDLMAGFYADCLRAHFKAPAGKGCDFSAVSRAILARWPRGLDYIKSRAWKEAQGDSRAALEGRTP